MRAKYMTKWQLIEFVENQDKQIKALQIEVKRLTNLNTCNSCKKLKVVLD